jgi:hypothetical protein
MAFSFEHTAAACDNAKKIFQILSSQGRVFSYNRIALRILPSHPSWFNSRNQSSGAQSLYIALCDVFSPWAPYNRIAKPNGRTDIIFWLHMLPPP